MERIPFTEEAKSAQQQQPPPTNDQDEQPIRDVATDGDLASTSPSLDFTPGFPHETPEHAPHGDAPSRGGDDATSPPAAQGPPPSKQHYLIPRSHWPDDPCEEHGGRGWEVEVAERRAPWARCRFLNDGPDGKPWEKVWRKTEDFIPLPPQPPAPTDSAPEVPTGPESTAAEN